METLNKNGVSITQTSGEEKYVKCCLGAFRGQIYFQYDFLTIYFLHSLRHLKMLPTAERMAENSKVKSKSSRRIQPGYFLS